MELLAGRNNSFYSNYAHVYDSRVKCVESHLVFHFFAGRRRDFPGCTAVVGGASACYPALAEARTPRRAPASPGGAHCRMPPPLATLVLVISTVLSIAGKLCVLLFLDAASGRSVDLA